MKSITPKIANSGLSPRTATSATTPATPRSHLWLLGYFIPLVLIVLILLARRMPILESKVPFRWIMAGRTEYVLIGPAALLLLGTLASRLAIRRQRILVIIFALLFVFSSTVLPFVLPIAMRPSLRKLATVIDDDGVCLQQTSYTCGPAAAVTALRRLHIDAREGDLAILFQTSPAAGTEPDIMAQALQERFGPLGLHAEYRTLDSASDLPRDGVTLAVVTYSLLVDHFIVVLRVQDTQVTVADPARGLTTWPREEFDRRWRRSAVLLTR